MGEERENAEEKLDELTKQAHAALREGKRTKADRLFKERDELARQAYNGE